MAKTRADLKRHLKRHGYIDGSGVQTTAHASHLEDELAFYILAYDLPEPEREYAFHPERKFRFDLCWPEQMVAVEAQGGTYSGGRHTRGKGYANDCDKLNEAQLHGWIVLQFASDQIQQTPQWCIAQIERALKLRGE